jgi:hypothetical protein
MIPYADLVAALRGWRERNGLPNFGPDVGGSSAPAMASTPAPSFPPPTPLATRSAPPMPPPGASAGTIDVEEEIDAAEIESEQLYENEGGDFAMSFGGELSSGQLATDPSTNPSPATAYGGFDDDFAAEPAPATGGTRPGIAVGKDLDTADELDDEPPRPSGKGKKKR